MSTPPIALTIAGSDPSGGAGIQADLKTFCALGVYGTAVITALTAQNTTAVSAIEAPTPGFVAEQLLMVMDDLDVAAAKTGMLYSAEVIAALESVLKDARFPVVVDPVCVAQSGAQLLQDDAVRAMKELIFPLATLLTPNLPEAELFCGMAIDPDDLGSIEGAGELLLSMGPKAVLIKGGHHQGQGGMVDYLFLDETPGEFTTIERPRVGTGSLHGTGCTLSAAIAAFLARGSRVPLAVEAGRDYLQGAIEAAFPLGQGVGPVNHLWLDAQE